MSIPIPTTTPTVLVGYRLFLVYATERYTSSSDRIWSVEPPLELWETVKRDPSVLRGTLYRRGRLFRQFDYTSERRELR